MKKKLAVLTLVVVFLSVMVPVPTIAKDVEEAPVLVPPVGYQFTDAAGNEYQLTVKTPEKSGDGFAAVGYFYDLQERIVYRGFSIRLARKIINNVPLTLSAAGLAQSMEIGDLDGTFLITTDIGALMNRIGWEFLYSERIDVGAFFSFLHDSRYGIYSTIRF